MGTGGMVLKFSWNIRKLLNLRNANHAFNRKFWKFLEENQMRQNYSGKKFLTICV